MTSKTVTLESKIVQSANLIFTEIEGELVLLGIDSGTYFGFDKVLSNLWTMLKEPIKVSKLIDQLILQYDVERTICEADLLEVLNKMANDKLIQLQ